MKNTIISKLNSKFLLAMLGALLLATTIPISANAQVASSGYGGYVTTLPQSPSPSTPPTYTYYPQPQPYPVYVQEPVTVPVYVSNPETPTLYSNSTNPNPPKAVAKAAPKKTETNSDLTANAIFGYDSFLPSGLLQWILFAILILLLVLLARRIYGANDRYQSTPLKHD